LTAVAIFALDESLRHGLALSPAKRKSPARWDWKAGQSLPPTSDDPGARAVMFRLAKRDDRRSQWLKGLAARLGFNRAIVALANKTARIAWAVLARKEDYLAAA
jgi:transposase